MIITAILELLYLAISVLLYPIKQLPDVSLPANISTSIVSAGSYFSSFDFIFPVSTFLIIMGIVLSVEAGVVIYKIVMWLIKKIPTIS